MRSHRWKRDVGQADERFPQLEFPSALIWAPNKGLITVPLPQAPPDYGTDNVPHGLT